MAAIPLSEAQEQLAVWLAASRAVAQSQSYEIESGDMRRKLTRADAKEIRDNIDFWRREVEAQTPASAGGRRRTRYPVPE